MGEAQIDGKPVTQMNRLELLNAIDATKSKPMKNLLTKLLGTKVAPPSNIPPVAKS